MLIIRFFAKSKKRFTFHQNDASLLNLLLEKPHFIFVMDDNASAIRSRLDEFYKQRKWRLISEETNAVYSSLQRLLGTTVL